MLPIEYERIQYLRGWIDTGVSANSNISFDLVINDWINGTSDFAYAVFGARDSNSNTATRQVNVYQYASGFYFGFNNGRATITKNNAGITYDGPYDGTIRLTSNKNEISVNFDCCFTKTGSRTLTAFTGGRNLYLGAVNNGGNADTCWSHCYWCKIYSDDTLVRDYIPVMRKADNVYGFYDLQNDTFSVANGSVDTPSSITTVTVGQGGKVVGDLGRYVNGKLIALADNGYSFEGWYENGEIISRENKIYFYNYGTLNYEARFRKNVIDDFSLGYRLVVKNRYKLTSGIIAELLVVNGEVNEDGLQKTTSKFEVKEVPSNIMPENVVLLYTPKGKKIYQGIIQAIEGNTITCREELAYFDTPFLFHANTNLANLSHVGINNISTVNLQCALIGYIHSLIWGSNHRENTSDGGSLNIRYRGLTERYPKRCMDNFVDVDFPLIDSVTNRNFEEFLIDIFKEFGVLTKLHINPTYNIGSIYNGYISVDYNYDEITISDNVESISNVSINIEYLDTNLLYVYNSSGATYRTTLAASGVNTDNWEGTIPCKEQLILSDDKVETLRKQYITNVYNHQIKFDVVFDDNYGFDDFEIGKKAKFYKGSNMYDSIITGIKYKFDLDDDIRSATITLGNARNNLTSKLNLNKTKK